MVIISPVKDDDVAGHQPAGVTANALPPAGHYTAASYHPAAIYLASTSQSSPPPFPPTSFPFLPLHQHHPWQPQPTTFFQANPELQSNDTDLSAVTRRFLPANAAPAPFAQPAVPPQPQMQPPKRMQYYSHQPAAAAMQGSQSYFGPWQSAASPVVHAAPLAAAAGTSTAHPAVPDAPPGDPAKPARRGRGRPRGSTAATKLANNAATAAFRQAAPCTHPAETMPRQERPLEQPVTTIAIAGRQDGKREEAVDAGGREEQEEVKYADTSAPGVRFQPSDEELIGYLKAKYLGQTMPVDIIKEFDVCKAHPKTVQEVFGKSVDLTWYVFSPRRRRYGGGSRPARSVGGLVGFWKSNTKETDVLDVDGRAIGKVNTLTFELGRQPKGVTTPWKMKEYRIPENQEKRSPDGSSMLLDKWVICKLFCKDEDTEAVPAQMGDQSGEVHEYLDETDGDGVGDGYNMGDQWLNNSAQDLCVEDYPLSDFALAYEDYPSEQLQTDEQKLGRS